MAEAQDEIERLQELVTSLTDRLAYERVCHRALTFEQSEPERFQIEEPPRVCPRTFQLRLKEGEVFKNEDR